MKQKIWSITLSVVFALFLITFCIGLPIYVRAFYFVQIDGLDLVNKTGLTKQQIITAYNQVLDFLTIGRPFGVGELRYTQSGKAHFEDCKILFDLNAYVLVISFVILTVAVVLSKLKVLKPYRFKNHHFMFYSAIALLILFATLVLMAVQDLEQAFTVFHKVFFPGKDNWVFDWYDDQIIQILPFNFFMSCGALISGSLIITCITIIIVSVIKKKKANG